MKKTYLIVLGFLLALFSFFPVTFKEYQFPLLSSLAIVLLAVPSYYVLCRGLSFKKAFLTITLISLFAICIETIGILTGFPYSRFSYSDVLGFKFFSVTPAVILFAFTPLVLGAVRIARVFTRSVFSFFLLSVFLLVFVDLILDPVAVALGFWIWEIEGVYYGVPFLNFLGWVFSGFLAVFLYYLFLKTKTVYFQEVSLLYSTWFFTGASLFLKLYVPFILGSLFLVWYYYSYDTINQTTS